MAARPQIPLRFDTEIIERVDALAALLSQRVEGVRVTRSDVFRLAVDRGLPVLEAELKKKGGRRA